MFHEVKLDIKNYASLLIYTSSEKIKDKLVGLKSSIRHTIPITNVSFTKVDRENICYSNAIIINDLDTPKMYYDKESNVAILNISEQSLRLPDLTYISLTMFSKILADNNKFLLHSSSLMHQSKNGIVLVGDANAGKTSLAFELMSKFNCKLISNDHSILGIEDDKVKILGGTKDIQMRLGAIQKFFPDLYQKISIEADDVWNKKLIVNDFIDSSMILPENNDVALLKDVYSINTVDYGESFIRRKQNIDEFLYLYESMSKIVKGTYNYITGFDYPMPSIETEENLSKLSTLCKKIVEQGAVSEAKGSINGLARELVKKYER